MKDFMHYLYTRFLGLLLFITGFGMLVLNFYIIHGIVIEGFPTHYWYLVILLTMTVIPASIAASYFFMSSTSYL